MEKLDYLQLNGIKTNAHIIKSYHFDLKVGNSFSGIGTNSSYCGCMYCNMPRSEFGNDPDWQGGDLRDLNRIRTQANAYQNAADAHRVSGHTGKLSSKDYESCENFPLWVYEPGHVLVLMLSPPPSLHIFLGLGMYL